MTLEEINIQFNNELQQQIEGTLPKGHTYNLGYPREIPKDRVEEIKNWIKSGNKLVKWQDKEKALNFISTQSPYRIGGGNKTQGSTMKYSK